jgi:hypothetical protein
MTCYATAFAGILDEYGCPPLYRLRHINHLQWLCPIAMLYGHFQLCLLLLCSICDVHRNIITELLRNLFECEPRCLREVEIDHCRVVIR